MSGILLAAAMLVAPGAPAFAHAVLLAADPADGASLATAPARATLTFNEPVAPVVVRLLGSDGNPIALPEPTASDQTVTVDLPSNLRDGGYILSYRVISLDSHPIGGSLAFAVGAASVPVEAAAVGDAERWDLAYSVLRWSTMTGLFLVIGGALFRAFVLPSDARSTEAAAIRVARIACPLTVIAALLAVGVRGAQLADSPLAEIFTLTPWRIALATSTGLGVALVLAGLAVVSLWPRRKASTGLAVVLAATGLGVTSHAALAGPIAASFAAYAIHIAVAAFWFGALPMLAIALAREPLAQGQAIVTRFSTFAVWGVSALLIAGIVLTLAQTGPDLSVWAGPAWTYGGYGILLAAKLALVAVVLAFAIRNKRVLTPLLMRRKGEAPIRLRRSIAWEAAFMTAVVALAAALGSSVPPRSIAALEAIHDHHAAGAEGAVVEVVRNGIEILLEADPATPGPNELIVHFLDQAKGVHLAPMEVSIAATLPSSGIEPLRRPAVAQGDGTYRVAAMPLTVAGVWKIRIEALISDFDKRIVTIDLPIGAPTP